LLASFAVFLLSYLMSFIVCSDDYIYYNFSPPPMIEPRQPFQQMARMMDSLIQDPFVPTQPLVMSKLGGMSRSVNHLSSVAAAGGIRNNHHHHKPIGPVRPRLNNNALRQNNNRTINNNLNNSQNSSSSSNNNLGELEFIPSNPNTAGLLRDHHREHQQQRERDWRSDTQRAEDSWKASLRKRDPDIQPTLPNIPSRSR
jgi:hypothetical protein